MTNERFKWDNALDCIVDKDSYNTNYTRESYKDIEIADLLNQLNKENNELKYENRKQYIKIQELEEKLQTIETRNKE